MSTDSIVLKDGRQVQRDVPYFTPEEIAAQIAKQREGASATLLNALPDSGMRAVTDEIARQRNTN